MSRSHTLQCERQRRKIMLGSWLGLVGTAVVGGWCWTEERGRARWRPRRIERRSTGRSAEGCGFTTMGVHVLRTQ
ncbi:hypothetical protein M6B38_382080 [Iris pallida]|uniref:Uncharacterized protein n=1 Tax=Iris pallida TaxID=29817 RepID=A0AAX6G857_IRIPA|nr:hypothetical protein M6B38_382080 [Iris pallida]